MEVENISQKSLEDLVLQIHSMHECFEKSQITVEQIFDVLNNFLSHLISSFHVQRAVGETLETRNPFKIPESVTRLDTGNKAMHHGREVHTIKSSTIQEALQEGHAVKLTYKLPVGGDYNFRIVANPDRTCARIEHDWSDGSSIITEEWLDVETMTQQIAELSNENGLLAQQTLFPNHPADIIEMRNPVRPYWEVKEGYLYNPHEIRSLGKQSKLNLSDILETYSNSEMYVKVHITKGKIINAFWRKELGPPVHSNNYLIKSEGFESSVDASEVELEETNDCSVYRNLQKVQLEDNKLISNRCAPAIGATVGFVFAGAGITYAEEYSRKKTRVDGIRKLAVETASGGVSTGIGHGVSKALSNTLGNSVIGMGSVVAVASLALSSAYDGIRFAKGKMTKIEYRKSTASNLGGAAGGLLGGLGTTLLVTFTVSNPVGWALALGAGAVGLVGGIAGAVGGSTIDKAIWNEGIDQVVHVYDFFGFKITRDQNPLPVAVPEVLIEKYEKRVKERHDTANKKKQNVEWERKCQALFMLLLKFMFPVYKDLLDMTAMWKEKLENAHPSERAIIQVFFDILED